MGEERRILGLLGIWGMGVHAVCSRLTETIRIGATTYIYGAANRIATVNGAAYTWDNNGNRLSAGTSTYTYTSNKLSSISGENLNVTFQYNGLGERVSQTVNGVPTHFTLDLNAELSQVLSDGTNTYLYGVSRIAQESTNGMQYFLTDALGSVRQLVDANGSVILAKDYEPYGEVLNSTGEGASSYGFTGEMQDASGLVYLRARYYASSQGRFISKDTWQGEYTRPASLNQWNYAYSNPLRYIDLNGQCPTPPSGMGQTICMALFIEPSRIEIIPGVIEVHGDNRTFSSNSNPTASRGYIWLKIKDPDSCGFQMNPSGYIIPPGGDLVGIWYTAPSQRNNWTVKSSATGSITLSFDLVISGILDLTDAAPHINGTITFTPNIIGGVDYYFTRDGFPWAEAYYHDGNGGVQTIFQDPAVFGNPYDLFAIEPNISWQRQGTFEALSRINGRPPEISTGNSSINTYPERGR